MEADGPYGRREVSVFPKRPFAAVFRFAALRLF